ncbi:MAG: enoyl-CoA hydratase/isomerase family protein [Solirubrobacteraceae bacterium]
MAVELTRDGALGYVTLDKPPANSYDKAFMDELTTAIETAGGDDDIKVVILRSASKRFFSAGADVKAFTQNPPDGNMAMIEVAHRGLARIAELPKLFIAQIAGHALGGGLEMALACDLRFGARGSYRLGVPEVTLGLLPGNGGTQRLPRLIGASRALELMVTGRQISPGEAHALGILNRLLAADRLEDETRAYAERLATGATKAIGAIKQVVHQGVDQSLADGLAGERERIRELFGTADADEGMAAFLEKRKPEYRGA